MYFDIMCYWKLFSLPNIEFFSNPIWRYVCVQMLAVEFIQI